MLTPARCCVHHSRVLQRHLHRRHLPPHDGHGGLGGGPLAPAATGHLSHAAGGECAAVPRCRQPHTAAAARAAAAACSSTLPCPLQAPVVLRTLRSLLSENGDSDAPALHLPGVAGGVSLSRGQLEALAVQVGTAAVEG